MLLFYPGGAIMDRFGRVFVAVPAMLVLGLGFLLLPLTGQPARRRSGCRADGSRQRDLGRGRDDARCRCRACGRPGPVHRWLADVQRLRRRRGTAGGQRSQRGGITRRSRSHHGPADLGRLGVVGQVGPCLRRQDPASARYSGGV